MGKVWQKGELELLNPQIERFTVGNDYLLDGRLFKYELAASLAHTTMLQSIDVISQDELNQISHRIKELHRQYGDYIELTIADEDVHSKLENLLIESLGELGKKVHTGRSRNDQILTVLRLYEKEQLVRTSLLYIDFLFTMLGMIESEGDKIIPGYTHTRQAMLSTVKQWGLSFVESGLDNLTVLRQCYSLADGCPLGTGSGFGVPLPLDRQMTARMLGFSRIVENPITAQSSRGKLEALIVDGLWQIMHDFSRLAADLLLFQLDELGYVKVSQAITTGSSIMPHKFNLDVLELIRARTYLMASYSAQLKSITAGLLSGYNRDIQETKQPLIQALELVQGSIEAMTVVISNITFDEQAVKKNLNPGILATDLAFRYVKQGIPFRDAYRRVANEISSIELDDNSIRQSIEQRDSLGSPATLKPQKYQSILDDIQNKWQIEELEFNKRMKELLK